MAPEQPAAIERLRDGLLDAGFEVVHQRGDGPPYSQTMLARDGFQIELLCDQGKWHLSAGQSDWRSIFEPHIWKAHLSGEPVGELDTLDGQVDFLLSRLDTLADHASMSDFDALRALKRANVGKRLGLKLKRD